MAKSKSFFGLRRGSTKSHTYSVLDGKQITKDRVVDVKNPRSEQQMQQRMYLATASAAYAAMKQIVDHSFEGITYGQRTMSEFIRLNTKRIRDKHAAGQEVFSYNPYQNRALFLGNYIMSRGSASPIDVEAIDVTANATGPMIQFMLDESQAERITAKVLAQAFGIGVGEMCTVCILADGTESDPLNSYNFTFVRIKCLSVDNTTPVTAENFDTYFTMESPNPVSITMLSDGLLKIKVNMAGGGVTARFCAIHSVKSDNGWLRSNTQIKIKNNDDLQYTYEDAFATYPIGQSYVLNGGEF